jgi:ubiquinone/menaquinone biosynthesis C-methylase UbiE
MALDQFNNIMTANTNNTKGLRGRHKLAFDWIPKGCTTLLDGGCAFGESTANLLLKSNSVFGCDLNNDYIEMAKKSYPSISFTVCPMENTPYQDEYFDAIKLTDVFEYVRSEQQTLNEIFRILKTGGSLIITTPHKGLFSFMDTTNYVWFLTQKLPKLYRRLFRLKHGKDPIQIPGFESLHRHYSVEDFVRLLDNSSFSDRYEIQEVFYGGLFCYAFQSNLFELLSIFFGRKAASAATNPFSRLVDIDYFTNYGKLSYDIGILVKKLPKGKM